jgi:hypothetical protein
LVAVLALIVASLWVAARLRRWLSRRARVRRAARAQAAERGALAVLSEHGFRVLGRQVRQSWGLVADGDPLRFTLIADYVVEREGKRWVAEVKTGERALDLRHGPTRRQLLEYRQAFGADGVLLVDAEGRRLHDVRFFGVDHTARGGALGPVALGVALGLGLGIGIGIGIGIDIGIETAPRRADGLSAPVPAATPASRTLAR